MTLRVPDTADAFRQIDDMADGLSMLEDLRRVLRKNAHRLYDRALENVSGVDVSFDGRTWHINRQTGKLASSLQVIDRYQGHPLTSAVVASAKYASFVEHGVNHPVDMKPFLMGKTVCIKVPPGGSPLIPYPVQTSIAGGNSRQGPVRTTPIQLKASTGRPARTENVIFRKVGRQSKGWIIPPRPGRPFMEEAAEHVRLDFEREVREVVDRYLASKDLEDPNA